MKHFSLFALALFLQASFTPLSAVAEAKTFPSHCKPDEYVYLNAKMGPKTQTRKVLSLCTDSAKEPLGKLVYRFGALGKVELEQVATNARPFQIFTRSPVPKVGQNIFAFTQQGYTYYVVEAFAMGSGISLMVFHKGKKIVDLFSGNDMGVDYESGMIELNFEAASSPVLQKKAPLHKF